MIINDVPTVESALLVLHNILTPSESSSNDIA